MERILEITAKINSLSKLKIKAIQEQHYEKAAYIRDEVQELENELEKLKMILKID